MEGHDRRAFTLPRCVLWGGHGQTLVEFAAILPYLDLTYEERG